ncbi:pyridine nucleotide-disulfide oxidoreductase [Pediococcus acidilactici NGRI 0510Q]|uniref:FAD-dependent oxidoreductase n=1 Tax=Pediococcus acidilactici TaxID=1254 RepID=UPI00029E62E5|nr:FAD-dependent oxidoreductase [Pediococcus acidilactici]KRN90045.1 pyridine nucleotide-disulfide oxidoreductase [Pediococcus acidilactici]QQC15241.1 FAD-dependent oxidoreductase [Pediococcus acidilactici]GAC45976.1 pyridine nucleotide-disulfide oxidoreductase [Pediococcus acidilactici NGRI 0510Q]
MMLEENVTADITVIGGGLAGVCAAIAAARLNHKVTLVQNRGVLGGNSSSEIRVWVAGATKHGVNRYARETGIMGELFVENQYRNPEGNPYLWDALLMEKVKEESNIRLFLNTEIMTVKMQDHQKIESITGFMSGSERLITFKSSHFIDCSGDGIVAFLAGAKFRLGRESRAEFNESLAPLHEDKTTLGSTLFFYTKDLGRPVKYVKPSFARDITKTSIIKNRIIKKEDNGCAYWWIEWGGELDVVHDNEKIRDELQAIVYGIWDYIKNSGNYDADNLTLEWIGSVPGKREYRRFEGDYTLKQTDIEEQVLFKDRIGFGGWSIDLHPASGVYNDSVGAQHSVPDGIYHIPYRILYSKNISNLFLAGRDVSTSHVAFGTVRVMATCAVMGQAAGTAAAIAVKHNANPRDVYLRYLKEYQQTLLREDGAILGIKNQDEHDLARQADITSTSTLTEINTYVANAEPYRLIKAAAFTIPVDPQVNQLDIFLTTEKATSLVVKWYSTGNPQNYIPDTLIGEQKIKIGKGFSGWQEVKVNYQPSRAQNLFVVIEKNENCTLYLGNQEFAGVLSYVNNPIAELSQPELHDYSRKSPLLYWTNQLINRRNFVFRVKQTNAFQPTKIINGYVRPYSGPNMWVTNFNGQPEAIELSWKGLQNIKQINLTFNDDVNEDIINLHHHRTYFDEVPELVKAFNLYYWEAGSWKRWWSVDQNRQRHLVKEFEQPIQTNKLKLELLQTNGSQQFSLFEVRVY